VAWDGAGRRGWCREAKGAKGDGPEAEGRSFIAGLHGITVSALDFEREARCSPSLFHSVSYLLFLPGPRSTTDIALRVRRVRERERDTEKSNVSATLAYSSIIWQLRFCSWTLFNLILFLRGKTTSRYFILFQLIYDLKALLSVVYHFINRNKYFNRQQTIVLYAW
jgi:hypothetical protein